jgi:hypothetical protein
MAVSTVRLAAFAYLVVFLAVATSFVSHHGGWAGDADRSWPESSSHYTPELLFNRWTLAPFHLEPGLYRLFVYVNLPAFAASRTVHRVLENLFPAFQERSVLGLSTRSYDYGLFITLGFIQWLIIGLAIDRYRSRRLA